MNGFYVTDVQAVQLAGMRLKLGETRAYPKNAGLTVEYQLIADPGACCCYCCCCCCVASKYFGVTLLVQNVN